MQTNPRTEQAGARWRVGIYAHDPSGRSGRARLDRQTAALAAEVARQRGWRHVATYADHGGGRVRPGLCRLLADAPGHLDLVVVDAYRRLSTDRRQLAALMAQLDGAGVTVAVLRPAAGRRLARLVANLAFADLVAGELR